MFLSVDPSFKYYDSIQTAVLVLRVPRALRLLRVARYDERERGREREREREEEEERERERGRERQRGTLRSFINK